MKIVYALDYFNSFGSHSIIRSSSLLFLLSSRNLSTALSWRLYKGFVDEQTDIFGLWRPLGLVARSAGV